MTMLVAATSAVLVALLAAWLLRVPIAAPVVRRPSIRRAALISWLVGLGAFGLVAAATGSLAMGVFPALVAGLAPGIRRARMRAAATEELHQAWPDALRDLIASVASGSSLGTALEHLAARGPMPLRMAFSRYPALARTVGVVPALEIIKAELADPTSDRVIEVLVLAHERGGAVVTTILQDLAETTTRDLWATEQIRTESLEQRINARAVFVLPWIVLVALTAREGAMRDFYAGSAGVLVIVIGAIASGFGMWLVGRLGREPEEPRVFGS